MAVLEIPCADLPKIDMKLPNITLFGGAQLNGFLDFSKGMPTNCTATFSLMLQLAPLLASMGCLLKILKVLMVVKEVFGGIKGPQDLSKLADIAKSIGDLAECFLALTPAGIAITIKGLLELIINFLNCFITQLNSLLEIQAKIDLNSAKGNPVLLASLDCARKQTDVSLQGLLKSLEPVQPLLEMTTMVASVAGLNLKLPSLSNIDVNQDMNKVITDLRGSVTALEDAIKALPL